LLIADAGMISTIIAIFIAVIGIFALAAVWARWRRQTGGGLGPTELSDGSMTVTPTGYPEEMKGHAKKITPVENNAAKL
jgi:hypothetical protein